jgi:diguanylate cyclase (GGDEF)-like protein
VKRKEAALSYQIEPFGEDNNLPRHRRVALHGREPALQARSGTVVLLDLNDFKRINDGYGQRAGDKVLQEFAKRLSRSTCGSDQTSTLGF